MPAMHGFFLVEKTPGLGRFLSFLGVANEQKDPNTCFPMYLDVIWHMKGFPFTLVESEASLRCLAVFVKKGPGLRHLLPCLGVAKELKDPSTWFPIHVDVIWPINTFPLAFVESGAGLPCLAFFWSKEGQFWAFLAIFGSCQGEKGT